MSAMRHMYLASGVGIILTAGPMAADSFAQSAREGLKHESVEPLVEVTPQLLRLQQDLVEALRAESLGAREEARMGQRTMATVWTVDESYFRELEALRVMSARFENRSISEKELLTIRINVRSDALVKLKEESDYIQGRLQVGEVTYTDVAEAKAKVLKAEIGIETLKQAARK